MDARALYRTVMIEGDLADIAIARRATASVFRALRDRLTPEEAGQALAQLPLELKRVWSAGDHAKRRPLKLSRVEFYDRVRVEAELTSRQTRAVVRTVFTALKEQLSPGEASDIEAQLPSDLKAVWDAA